MQIKMQMQMELRGPVCSKDFRSFCFWTFFTCRVCAIGRMHALPSSSSSPRFRKKHWKKTSTAFAIFLTAAKEMERIEHPPKDGTRKGLIGHSYLFFVMLIWFLRHSSQWSSCHELEAHVSSEEFLHQLPLLLRLGWKKESMVSKGCAVLHMVLCFLVHGKWSCHWETWLIFVYFLLGVERMCMGIKIMARLCLLNDLGK